MITVQYKDFEEMQAVARQILGLADVSPAVVAPAAKAVPAADAGPVPVASTSAAAPVQTAPVAAPTPSVAPAPAAAAPVQPAAPIPAAPVPTAAPSYTLDDLARPGMTLMDSGRQGELLHLLAQFGVSALPELPQSQYGAFATALREKGAQI